MVPAVTTVPVKLAAADIVCPLMAPEVMVPLPALILALVVVRPPGKPVTTPVLPSVRLVAWAPPMVMVPAVLLVEVPVSTVRLPETEATPVPVALPLVMLKDAEGVEATAVLAVCNNGACKAVVKKPLPNGRAPEPRSALPLLAGNRLVLIATLARLLKAVLAPPPPPPRQLPTLVQIL
jgi:hypothetical protein